ncbi:unnamed protein product [Caenorhabditis auriculariae]|uniref:Uncharacterized protein n=1 Tax=Caenorhabditis auriculariae TaxID=2777116 RepID=A0A8S1GP18_9PELO|nr:unnamed protein product [Caenorhabditis auriculariae]
MHLLFLATLLSLVISGRSEVRLLLAVWRHGDRAPEQLPYPGDPYNETFWPRGWNQLTNLGIEQASKLGNFLRRRYKDSVLKTFHRSKVHIRASDADRAIETAQAVTAAMFPPEGAQVWTHGKLRHWQPIPIRTNGGKPDPMLRPSQVRCPAYEKLVLAQRKILQEQTDEKFKVPLSIVTERTGHYSRYSNIKDVYNVILEHYNGLPLPSWAYEKVGNATLLEHVSEVRRISRLQLFDSIEKAKFMGGYLINNWAEHMVSVSNGTSKKQAVLYSSHDGTLSALLYGLNISNDLLIPYTACAMIELHQDETVRIFYRNTTTEDPLAVHQLIVPGCTARCPLPTFLQLIEHIRIRTLDELHSHCASGDASTSSLRPAVLPIFILSVIVTSLLFL